LPGIGRIGFGTFGLESGNGRSGQEFHRTERLLASGRLATDNHSHRDPAAGLPANSDDPSFNDRTRRMGPAGAHY
jgi:hypothetical protein